MENGSRNIHSLIKRRPWLAVVFLAAPLFVGVNVAGLYRSDIGKYEQSSSKKEETMAKMSTLGMKLDSLKKRSDSNAELLCDYDLRMKRLTDRIKDKQDSVLSRMAEMKQMVWAMKVKMDALLSYGTSGTQTIAGDGK